MQTPTGRRLAAAAAAALAVLLLGFPVHAADGDLDPSFWDDGQVVLGFAAGAADLDFGGLATKASGELVAGYSVFGSEVSAYWRTLTDSSWAAPCRVVVGSISPQIDTFILDLAFDASGRLIVLAKKSLFDGADGDFAVLAYDFPSCLLDPQFGTGGVVDLPGIFLFTSAKRLAVMNDGRILVAGGEMIEDAQNVFHRHSRIVRLEPDGDLDPTFAGDGVVLGPDRSSGVDVAVASNGHVVLAAGSVESDEYDFHVQDFDEDGSFLGESFVAFDLGLGDDDVPAAIAATPDGRVVIAGTASGNGINAFTWAAMALLSWDAEGDLALDPGFSGDGRLWFTFNSRSYSSLSDVVIQGGSRILVAGAARTQILDSAMAVAGLALEGTFDSTFYPPGNGRRLVDFDVAPPEADLAGRLVLQQGRAVLGGRVDIGDNKTSVGLARLVNQWLFADGFELLEVSGWDFAAP